jgi:phosphoglycolate phosphatase-like HAD superfamily hydrolase
LNKEIVYIGDSLSDYKAAMDNSINFIARINNNENIFKDIECVKINNLANLENVIIENF